jgi:hypothetical protein
VKSTTLSVEQALITLLIHGANVNSIDIEVSFPLNLCLRTSNFDIEPSPDPSLPIGKWELQFCGLMNQGETWLIYRCLPVLDAAC